MMKASVACAGSPRKLTTKGEAADSSQTRTFILSRKKRIRVPRIKRGTASFRYHSIRLSVFMMIFLIVGTLRGGNSMKKSGFSPGTTFDARYPARMRTPIMQPDHHRAARPERGPSIPKKMGSGDV